MNGPSITIGPLHAVFQLHRLLAILALAFALVAIPAFSPGEASAHRFSAGQVVRMCSGAGGTIHYEFFYQESGYLDYIMECTLPSGNSFDCWVVGGSLDCY